MAVHEQAAAALAGAACEQAEVALVGAVLSVVEVASTGAVHWQGTGLGMAAPSTVSPIRSVRQTLAGQAGLISADLAGPTLACLAGPATGPAGAGVEAGTAAIGRALAGVGVQQR